MTQKILVDWERCGFLHRYVFLAQLTAGVHTVCVVEAYGDHGGWSRHVLGIDVPSLELTQPLKIGLLKRKVVFQPSRYYVSFRECSFAAFDHIGMILRDAARMRNNLSQMRPKNILSLPLLAKRTVKIFNPKKSKDSPESFDRMCDKHKRRTPEIVLNDLNEYAICIHVRIFF